MSAFVHRAVAGAKRPKWEDDDSAETGCTVVQDLGDGYTATYGQLANLTCSEGDVLEAGETLGAVGKVTRYYTVEGTNVYFAMEQDGKPVNPMDYFGDI